MFSTRNSGNFPVSLVSASSRQQISSSDGVTVIKSRAFHNLKPKVGEKILDIGCAEGAITSQIKKLGCTVLGVDINTDNISIARKNGVDALFVNAEEMSFDREFDAVFSSSALHWIRRPDIVLEAINRALKSKGRFVGEMSAYGNLAEVMQSFLEVLASEGKSGLYLIPWYLPTETDYRDRLMQAGFMVNSIMTTRKTFDVNSDLYILAESFFPIFSSLVDNKPGFLQKVSDSLASRLHKKDGKYQIEYVSMDFIAIKEKDIV